MVDISQEKNNNQTEWDVSLKNPRPKSSVKITFHSAPLLGKYKKRIIPPGKRLKILLNLVAVVDSLQDSCYYIHSLFLIYNLCFCRSKQQVF